MKDTGRVATVIAAEKATCLALDKRQFLNVLTKSTSVIESIHSRAQSYPTDEEILTFFTALRIQTRHEKVMRDAVQKNPKSYFPSEHDVHIRKTQVIEVYSSIKAGIHLLLSTKNSNIHYNNVIDPFEDTFWFRCAFLFMHSSTKNPLTKKELAFFPLPKVKSRDTYMLKRRNLSPGALEEEGEDPPAITAIACDKPMITGKILRYAQRQKNGGKLLSKKEYMEKASLGEVGGSYPLLLIGGASRE